LRLLFRHRRFRERGWSREKVIALQQHCHAVIRSLPLLVGRRSAEPVAKWSPVYGSQGNGSLRERFWWGAALRSRSPDVMRRLAQDHASGSTESRPTKDIAQNTPQQSEATTGRRVERALAIYFLTVSGLPPFC
jgi:hypothetical protein